MVVIDVARELFSSVWELFQIEYPGTGMTFAVIGIGALVVVLSLRIITSMLGITFSPAAFFSPGGVEGKGGNNSLMVIPENRKGDSH